MPRSRTNTLHTIKKAKASSKMKANSWEGCVDIFWDVNDVLEYLETYGNQPHYDNNNTAVGVTPLRVDYDVRDSCNTFLTKLI